MQRYTSTPIIVSIGNNDVLVHYSAPKAVDKAQYYEDWRNMLFIDVHQNDKWRTIYGELEATVRDGGYYKYTIAPEISVLVLNSVYFSVRNSEDMVSASN
jgi:hypothetical protein